MAGTPAKKASSKACCRLLTHLQTACAAGGFLDCVKKTVQWEGLGGLYKVRRRGRRPF